MKTTLIITVVWLVSCMSKEKDVVKSDYDEPSLKALVLSTPNISECKALNELDSILSHASKDSVVFRKTISFLENPFSNPNSSYRNQILYSKLLEARLRSNWYNGEEKAVEAKKLKLLQQNNIGKAANNFTYITPDGDKRRLYSLNSDFILIFFSNPECPACKEMKEGLAASSIITNKIRKGKLKLLALYTDKDEQLWRNHLLEYPQEWIKGRDEDEFLYKNGVYDLRAIPSIYLLSKNKTVLLKDCISIEAIENMLELQPAK